jgi:hypothetical protein
MKTITKVLPLVLLLACSCGPKNEEVTQEQVETQQPHEALDSIANTRKDGVKTDGTDSAEAFPLP